ncbi:hypothetical protein TOT_030000848 [Theileria orientalis strain Shintoku]|uniref:Uncharacterized protein n=1 Tax=Theileria orientalis strain Shintoku TaxID=869250 RepID=J4D9T4_THEOR|nr:hypothetical protein TOT_030000848 [Theileria orientalis strain Shintoku]PVC54441.1 hypothetical protein MACL_00003076 [Theileria orientalis]BAM41585.1 hypothetical protein TOT_030000848 [Theileria orientalis strain Shintoku]|eukprot:XP_009691886.1 hypothetical protein TOT_030000848 [Theileria orientalis strain Shintoku]
MAKYSDKYWEPLTHKKKLLALPSTLHSPCARALRRVLVALESWKTSQRRAPSARPGDAA